MFQISRSLTLSLPPVRASSPVFLSFFFPPVHRQSHGLTEAKPPSLRTEYISTRHLHLQVVPIRPVFRACNAGAAGAFRLGGGVPSILQCHACVSLSLSFFSSSFLSRANSPAEPSLSGRNIDRSEPRIVRSLFAGGFVLPFSSLMGASGLRAVCRHPRGLSFHASRGLSGFRRAVDR